MNQQAAAYGLQIENFTSDWKDGRVLSALCDSLRPGVLLPDRSLTGLSSPLQATERAMDAAAQHYDIPKILDAADLVEQPDVSNLSYRADPRRSSAP